VVIAATSTTKGAANKRMAITFKVRALIAMVAGVPFGLKAD
jgi:hypothetical protein